MGIPLAVLAVILVAVCVWLAVRSVNRHERWSKWTAVALAAALMGYPLGFGPACWLTDRDVLPEAFVYRIYSPFVGQCISLENTWLADAVMWYGEMLPTPQPRGSTPQRASTAMKVFYGVALMRAGRE